MCIDSLTLCDLCKNAISLTEDVLHNHKMFGIRRTADFLGGVKCSRLRIEMTEKLIAWCHVRHRICRIQRIISHVEWRSSLWAMLLYCGCRNFHFTWKLTVKIQYQRTYTDRGKCGGTSAVWRFRIAHTQTPLQSRRLFIVIERKMYDVENRIGKFDALVEIWIRLKKNSPKPKILLITLTFIYSNSKCLVF